MLLAPLLMLSHRHWLKSRYRFATFHSTSLPLAACLLVSSCLLVCSYPFLFLCIVCCVSSPIMSLVVLASLVSTVSSLFCACCRASRFCRFSAPRSLFSVLFCLFSVLGSFSWFFMLLSRVTSLVLRSRHSFPVCGLWFVFLFLVFFCLAPLLFSNSSFLHHPLAEIWF